MDLNSMGSLDPYRDPGSQSGSGSRGAKMAHKHRKKLLNLISLSAGCSLLRAEIFSCSLDTSKFTSVFFSSVFDLQNPGSGLDQDSDPDSLEMLVLDRNSNESGSTALSTSAKKLRLWIRHTVSLEEEKSNPPSHPTRKRAEEP
jgi:hypothetical protein